ncbi:hypothetical protein ACIP79_34305 [Streptomyces sp. NPDC088747]|uniref:hypothetical protein n=1 Tax=Streptomyces sp. NPDC088747 TaxID=3365886 RepID=UPI0038039AEB
MRVCPVRQAEVLDVSSGCRVDGRPLLRSARDLGLPVVVRRPPLPDVASALARLDLGAR